MDEIRLALFIAELVRETTRVSSKVATNPIIVGAPTMIELAQHALKCARASRLATYVALDPIAREVLAFVVGPDEPPPPKIDTEGMPSAGAMELATEIQAAIESLPRDRAIRAIAASLDGVRDGATSRATEEMRQTCEHLAQAGWKPHT